MRPRHLLLLLITVLPTGLTAQIRGSNTTYTQLGNIPNAEPNDYKSAYNLSLLNYQVDGFSVKSRLEFFLTEHEERNYLRLTQMSGGYRNRNWEVVVGHYFTTFGRGLTLRAWDIPGSINENSGERIRYSLYRDFLGAMGSYTDGRVTVKLIKAEPLVSVFSPKRDRDLRRVDDLYGGAAEYRLSDHRTGMTLVHNRNVDNRESTASVFAEGRLWGGFTYYAELAAGHTALSGDDSRTGLYASLGYARPGFGLSLQVKDYQNFFLGSGYNDPPTLTKENQYPILNRKTHELQLLNERGLMVESFHQLAGAQTLNIAVSYAVNDVTVSHQYVELFGEWSYRYDNGHLLLVWVDAARDELQGDAWRGSTGVQLSFPIGEGRTLKTDVAGQLVESNIDGNRYCNVYASLSGAIGSGLSGGVTWEGSGDPTETDEPSTIQIEEGVKQWLGVNVAYDIEMRHRLDLFVGSRRGGPACTSGICFDVLGFSGLEVNWTTRF